MSGAVQTGQAIGHPALPLAKTEERPDYSQRVGPSFLIGVYLAINAIRDLYLLVEGPDCVHMKTQFVQGNHDWMSTLTSVSGFHRIANTALHPDHMTGSREESLLEAMLRLAKHPAVPALALTSMPMAFITGADYERMTREVAEASGKQVIQIPGKSLSGDWLDGYAEALLALAHQLDFADGKLDPNKVGIVGNLFDRNEGDHTANIAELERIFAGLDLDLTSVWLSGRSFDNLLAIKDAGTIISLPYGRRAARRLARRTGAKLVQMPLPFGLPACEAWVRQLGDHFDRQQLAEQVIDRELGRVVPKLEWVIPEIFQNLRIGYVGDPHLFPGLVEFLDMMGVTTKFCVITNRAAHCRELPESLADIPQLQWPKQRSFNTYLSSFAGGRDVDMLISNNSGIGAGDLPTLEFGFPSVFNHNLYERPFLGFGGALALADSIANTMRSHWVAMAKEGKKRGGGGPESGGQPDNLPK